LTKPSSWIGQEAPQQDRKITATAPPTLQTKSNPTPL
jgi:hypothetical protein